MNKLLRSVAVLIVAGVVLVGCNKNSPKSVATQWLNSFYHADYKAALPLSTDITKAQLEQFDQLSSYVNDSAKKDLKKLTVTIKDIKETGDTAYATYVVSDNTKDQQLMLVKLNGKWLVAFTKNDSYKASDFTNTPLPSADTAAVPVIPVDTSATDTAKNRD
jgi:ketosteroid isomerase-like protein